MNTTKKLLVIIGLGLAITANTYFYISKDDASAKSASPTQAQAILLKIGEKCLDFGERAVAKDTPIIEFQQLEREAKRTNVIQRCMTDNGYQQNPAWLSYAQPIAKTDANETSISIDEAIVSLSRKHMQVFMPVARRPGYWIKKKDYFEGKTRPESLTI